MPVPPPTADQLLDAAYTQLEFDRGDLLSAEKSPKRGAAGTAEWIEKGDWLKLADDVRAEKIFFVGENPVIVFAKLGNLGAQTFRNLYQRIWSIARPPLLFLARPGELAVYDLSKPPPKADEQPEDKGRRIGDVVTSIAEVQTALHAFHRENIETGAIFGNERFGDNLNRADRALIRDLQTVRRALDEVEVAEKPALSHFHGLLGRCIFARYLEDRGIITADYFAEVAARRQAWQELLEKPFPGVPLEPEMRDKLFVRVLRNLDFTYALFDKLAKDFNGDTFPIQPGERERITSAHLKVLREFLSGQKEGEFFFHAYRFDVVPIELISSIYEEFYNEDVGKGRNQGSHYTPPALVEYVLNRTLTPAVLATEPRVIDSACGSGIFLVEAFRRMARYRWATTGKAPTCNELRALVRDKIAGIDLNPEAVRVAAFSLYLAMLHYQQPPDILRQTRQPYLKWVPETERKTEGAEYFDVLLAANAFDVLGGDTFPPEVIQRFGPDCADVCVGNPPWGYPKDKKDIVGRKALATTLDWCKRNELPVADKELSQAFIHLTLKVLRDGGRAGLLLSSGLLFKSHKNSVKFREKWLTSSNLEQVTNFAHVRKSFFTGEHRKTKGIAPFISAIFEKTAGELSGEEQFEYWSAKQTVVIKSTQFVVLNPGDMHRLSQQECLQNEKLWRVYWWGNHRDENLVSKLRSLPSAHDLSNSGTTRYLSGGGFIISKHPTPTTWPEGMQQLPVSAFQSRYGEIDWGQLCAPPPATYREGIEDVYEGPRLLVKEGMGVGQGRILARVEDKTFCFTDTIIGLRLDCLKPWQREVVLGIYWSSLGRYFFWMTATTWGTWNDKLLEEEIVQLPIALPSERKDCESLLRVIGQLKALEEEIIITPDIFNSPAPSIHPELALDDSESVSAKRKREKKEQEQARARHQFGLETELNELVSDLYKLTAAERDLVRDMTGGGIDFFYRGAMSDTVKEVSPLSQTEGIAADLAAANDGLAAYLRVFLERWNYELKDDKAELAWRVVAPKSGAPMLAIYFETRYRKSLRDPFDRKADQAWDDALQILAENSRIPVGGRVLVDTFFRHVSDSEILIIKRNERRFWTKTAAREDAEATLLKMMILQEQNIPA